jgi:hypothetical protein
VFELVRAGPLPPCGLLVVLPVASASVSNGLASLNNANSTDGRKRITMPTADGCVA